MDDLSKLATTCDWDNLSKAVEKMTAEDFTYEEGLVIEKALDRTPNAGLEIVDNNVTNRIVRAYCKSLV